MAPCEPVTVLAVGSGPVIEDLARILGHSKWNLLRSETLSEAISVLPRVKMAVLVCQPELADGTWKDLLRYAFGLPCQPPVIVASNQADNRFWMEVLDQGGYNVLGNPFEEREVFRIVSAAWLRQRDQMEMKARANV